jgi:hypothetical protein
MTSQGKTVMWIGLFLIGMNIIINWQQIRALIFTGPSSSGGGGGGLLPGGVGGIIGNLLPGGAELRSAK